MKKIDYSKINPFDLIDQKKVGLLDSTVGYNTERYGFAYQCWKKQEQIRWLPEEVPLAKDIEQWESKITNEEKNLLSQIFKMFAQSDIEVMNNYMYNYVGLIKPLEIQMMLGSFANAENTHLEAYALLLKTMGMPASDFEAFTKYSAMKNKVDYFRTFGNKTCADVAITLGIFAAFIEGLSLFASFAMLLNFPRFNKMQGMGQIVTWSIRDESLHIEGMLRLFHEWCKETGTFTKEVKSCIYDACKRIVSLEKEFAKLAFELGSVEGLTCQDIENYIDYIADYRLVQLKLKPFGKYFIKENGNYKQTKDHPLQWLVEMLNGVELSNFFEVRATEYSHSTEGTWEKVWKTFDQKIKHNLI